MNFSIPLRIAERAGVDRVDELVRSGVPFPKGALKSPAAVRLIGHDGETPVDTSAIAHWDDGSIKWLLMNFPASVSANTTKAFTLHSSDRPAAPGQLRLSETDSSYLVDTGALRFAIDRTRFGLITNAEARGADSQWHGIAPDGIDIVVTDNHYRDFCAPLDDAHYSAFCEELGGAHAVFKITGQFARTTREGPHYWLHYTLRLTCSAGSSSVKLALTVHNRETADVALIRGLRITARLGSSEASRGVVGLSERETRAADLRAEGSLLAIQTGPTNLLPWEDFAFRIIDGRSRNVIEQIERSPGWAALEADDVGVHAAIRHIWKKHPKGFELTSGSLGVLLHPPSSGPMDLPQGMDSTDDVLLTFHTPNIQGQAVNSSFGFQEPLFAAAAPEWYCESGAMGWLSPANVRDMPRYERLLSVAFDGLVKSREAEAMYGARDFGDTSGDYTSQPDYWLNQEYDTPHCCFMMFARSGDIGYLRWGEDSARHQIDVDTIHFSTSNPDAIGSQYKHEMAHIGRVDTVTGAHRACVDHLWAEGICEHYLLTGDMRALEVAREIGDFLARRSEMPNTRGNPRAYAWPIIALCAIHEATGDSRYLKATRAIVEQVFARNHPTRGIWQDSWGADEDGLELLGNKTFMVGVLMEGMAFYHRITDDPRAADWLVKTARTICGEAWVEQDKGFYYTPSLKDRDHGRTTDLRELLGLVYAYKLSGDPMLAEIACKSFDAGQNALLAKMPDSSVSGKQFSTLARSTPRFAALALELVVPVVEH